MRFNNKQPVENDKKKDNSLSRKTILIMIIMAIIVFLFPLLVNWMLFKNWIATPSDLSDPDWLSFYGSFFGGAMGGIATLVTVFFTIKYYEKQEHNHKIELEVQADRHIKELKQREKNEHKPIIVMEINGTSHTGTKMECYRISINNVNQYPALNVKIDGHYFSVLRVNNEYATWIFLSGRGNSYIESLEVYIEDILGNSYNQLYQLVETDIVDGNGSNGTKYYYRLLS